jgi:hypothetical protein
VSLPSHRVGKNRLSNSRPGRAYQEAKAATNNWAKAAAAVERTVRFFHLLLSVHYLFNCVIHRDINGPSQVMAVGPTYEALPPASLSNLLLFPFVVGGMVAQVASIDLGWSGRVHWSHNHGSPRVFNLASAQLYEKLFNGCASQL